MKKYLWIIGTLLFFSCTGMFDLGEETFNEPEPTKFTYVKFENMGIYAVTVYDNYLRQPQDKVDTIQSGITSQQKEWKGAVNKGVEFYLTYHLPITTGFTLAYDPPLVSAVVEASIPRYETKTVRIPSLVMPADQTLVNDTYIIIRNSGNRAFRFKYYNGYLLPIGSNDSLVDTDTTVGAYKITPGPASYYKVIVNNINEYQMPVDITTFQAGYCYSLVFDGTTVSLAKTGSVAEITLANINNRVW